MKTYFVSCLVTRIMDCLQVLGSNGVCLAKTYTDGGFAIMQITCTQEQATAVWDAGFHVAEQ